MKKVVFVLAAMVLSMAAYAQENLSDAIKARNAGNEAYNAKDYVAAIAQYEIYLSSDEEGVSDDLYTLSLYENCFNYAGKNFVREKNYPKAFEYFQKYYNFNRSDTKTDGAFLFNYANVASKIEQDTLSLRLFKQCLDLGYNKDASTYSIALIYRNGPLQDIDKMKETLKSAVELYPDSRYRASMLGMLTAQLLKEAIIPFNEASTWNKKAGEASAANNIEGYLSNMEKAAKKYREAIPLFESVLEYDKSLDSKVQGNITKAKTNLAVCTESISRFEDYKKTIKR